MQPETRVVTRMAWQGRYLDTLQCWMLFCNRSIVCYGGEGEDLKMYSDTNYIEQLDPIMNLCPFEIFCSILWLFFHCDLLSHYELLLLFVPLSGFVQLWSKISEQHSMRHILNLEEETIPIKVPCKVILKKYPF